MSELRRKLCLILILIVPLVIIGFTLLPNVNINLCERINDNEIEGDTRVSALTTRGPILIEKNADFAAVSTPGGTGDPGNPYVIENYEIIVDPTSWDLGIHIMGTTAHFRIQNCVINNNHNGYGGIGLWNVRNGIVKNNTIFGSRHGIGVINSGNITILENTVYDSSSSGIRIGKTNGQIVVSNNTLSNNTCNSIWLETYFGSCSGVMVNNNTMIEGTENGIFIDARFNASSTNHIITNNTVKNMEHGIMILSSSESSMLNATNNIITGNYFVDNIHGIGLYGNNTFDNQFSYNFIMDNQDYGAVCDLSANNNFFTLNNFIGNINAGTQVLDNGEDNEFLSNYYDEWTTPDSEPDGYVDFPYDIDGTAGNSDPLPLASPIDPAVVHFLSQVVLTSPTGGEELINSIDVTWTECFESWGFAVYYDLYKSSDGGATWDELVTDLDDTHYEWDLFSETPGDNYRIKVIANSTGGLSNEDVSGVFSIIEHVLSQVVLAYPIGGEEYVDSVTITWSECVDNWNYSVFYDLYKSSDGGATWVDIMTNVQDTHYKWSILYEAGGNNYRVKVVANSTGGLSTEDVSGVFSIREHYLSQVELTHPTGGEKIVDSVDITWTECVDSEGYSVSYDLHVSSDGGATWAVLMEDVQDTHYKWNVVSEPAGNNYVIKVIANTTIGLSNEDVSEAFSIAKRTDDLSGILGTVGIIAIIAAIVGAAVVTGFITNKKRKNAKLIRYKKTLDSRLVNLSGTLNKNPPKPKKPIKPKESTNQ